MHGCRLARTRKFFHDLRASTDKHGAERFSVVGSSATSSLVTATINPPSSLLCPGKRIRRESGSPTRVHVIRSNRDTRGFRGRVYTRSDTCLFRLLACLSIYPCLSRSFLSVRRISMDGNVGLDPCERDGDPR